MTKAARAAHSANNPESPTSGIHPDPLVTYADLDKFADDMENMLAPEKFCDIADWNGILTTQMHVLDALFRHLMLDGLGSGNQVPRLECLHNALQVQRLCVSLFLQIGKNAAAAKNSTSGLKEPKNDKNNKGLAAIPPQGTDRTHPQDQAFDALPACFFKTSRCRREPPRYSPVFSLFGWR